MYHRHDEKELNWEPGGVRSGAGILGKCPFCSSFCLVTRQFILPASGSGRAATGPHRRGAAGRIRDPLWRHICRAMVLPGWQVMAKALHRCRSSMRQLVRRFRTATFCP